MGMPLTAGFVGKLYLFSTAVATGHTSNLVLVIIAMVNSAIGAVYYLRVVGQMYLQEEAAPTTAAQAPTLQLGVAACALITLLMGIMPAALMTRFSDTVPSLFAERPTADGQAPQPPHEDRRAVLGR